MYTANYTLLGVTAKAIQHQIANLKAKVVASDLPQGLGSIAPPMKRVSKKQKEVNAKRAQSSAAPGASTPDETKGRTATHPDFPIPSSGITGTSSAAVNQPSLEPGAGKKRVRAPKTLTPVAMGHAENESANTAKKRRRDVPNTDESRDDAIPVPKQPKFANSIWSSHANQEDEGERNNAK